MPDVTAAGIPVKLSSGEIVIVTPYNNRDMMSVLKLIQKKNLENLVAAIPKDLPTALYRASYAEAIKLSKEFDINNKNVLQEMADEEILQFMLTLAIQKTYKGDASKKALEIMDNVEDFNNVMTAVNGQGAEADETEIEVKEGDKESPPESVQS